MQQILARLYDADRGVRQAAAAGLTKGLQDNARLLTFIFNTLVLDHKSDCELRHFADPMDSRHLANEIGDDVVEALMTAAERHHATVQRYYRLKGRLLRLDSCTTTTATPRSSRTCRAATGRRPGGSSRRATRRSAPRPAAIIREFFDERWIDAELRPGKRGGAFSSSAVPSVHPYILMNYTDKLRDVMTLAHELGHGLHQYLSRSVGYLQCDTPLTTAETASVFGEMLTFQRLLEMYPDPRTRLALLCSKIEDGFATVFRQVVLTRFEQALHQARREQGELTTEQINELWLAANRPMHGDVVQLTEGYAWWWLYIGHFIHVAVLLLRLRLRRAAGAGPGAEVQAGGRRRSCRSTWSCSRPAARTRRTCCWPSSAWTSPTPASGSWACGCSDDMVTEAEQLADQV